MKKVSGSIVRLVLMAVLVMSVVLSTGQTARAAAGPAPVNLGSATTFVVLTKTGITNVPTSAITGDMGTSPIASTAITGFSLTADSTNTFSTSSQVTGKIYAANYASPTPSNLTVAIGNMQTAYTDAAGRSLPDFTELYAGNLSGKTLVPGLYKWSSGVLITSNVTLAGPSDAVWIFQISGNLTMGSGARMLLSGGAQAKNIFWQVGGGTGVEIGTTAHVEGTLLAAKAIHFRTGSSMNGRALAQTAVTLAQSTLVIPLMGRTNVFVSETVYDGWVLESGENSNVGGSSNNTASTFLVGDDVANKQYRSILQFKTAGLPNNAIITEATIKLMSYRVIGTNPFTTHGALLVDIRIPFFGTVAGLQASDFQAGANANAVGRFNTAPVSMFYSAMLNDNARSRINLTGITQFRLRFALDDNNDNSADTIAFYSGDATQVNRPQLVVQFYVP